jgi:uncharacterized membrane protein
MVITGYIVWKIFVSIDSVIGPLQKRFPLIDIPGIGFVVVLLFILFTGILASNLIGRRLFELGDRILNGLPLIRRIYFALKEISQALLADRKTAFQRVVLIRYPHENSYALAFVTRAGVAYFDSLVGKKMVNVFIPTTPNPTSGFMLMIPKSDIISVEISVEEAMKMVISGGAFSPPVLESLSAQKTT